MLSNPKASTKEKLGKERNIALGVAAVSTVLVFADGMRQTAKGWVGIDESVSTEASAGSSGESTVVV